MVGSNRGLRDFSRACATSPSSCRVCLCVCLARSHTIWPRKPHVPARSQSRPSARGACNHAAPQHPASRSIVIAGDRRLQRHQLLRQLRRPLTHQRHHPHNLPREPCLPSRHENALLTRKWYAVCVGSVEIESLVLIPRHMFPRLRQSVSDLEACCLCAEPPCRPLLSACLHPALACNLNESHHRHAALRLLTTITKRVRGLPRDSDTRANIVRDLRAIPSYEAGLSTFISTHPILRGNSKLRKALSVASDANTQS